MSDYSTYSDKQLLSLLKDSDKAAFEVIYKKYWQALFSVAARKLDDLYLVEELVQDLFTSLWLRRSELNIEAPLAAYLLSAIRYKIVDACIRLKTGKKKLLSFGLDELDGVTVNPFIYRLELKNELDNLLSVLPEKSQLVFQLSKLEGISNAEIAN